MGEPCLYIWIRTDLESMVPGKAAAQACHAATQLACMIEDDLPQLTKDMYFNWIHQAKNFGTVKTYKAKNENDLSEIFSSWKYKERVRTDVLAGTIIDPTYPVRDGKITHLLPLRTVTWVFTNEEIKGEWY